MRELFETSVGSERFGWRCLAVVSTCCTIKKVKAYLGVLQSLEERRDADETDLVVPHDMILLLRLLGHVKGVLEHCKASSAAFESNRAFGHSYLRKRLG